MVAQRKRAPVKLREARAAESDRLAGGAGCLALGHAAVFLGYGGAHKCFLVRLNFITGQRRERVEPLCSRLEAGLVIGRVEAAAPERDSGVGVLQYQAELAHLGTLDFGRGPPLGLIQLELQRERQRAAWVGHSGPYGPGQSGAEEIERISHATVQRGVRHSEIDIGKRTSTSCRYSSLSDASRSGAASLFG